MPSEKAKPKVDPRRKMTAEERKAHAPPERDVDKEEFEGVLRKLVTTPAKKP